MHYCCGLSKQVVGHCSMLDPKRKCDGTKGEDVSSLGGISRCSKTLCFVTAAPIDTRVSHDRSAKFVLYSTFDFANYQSLSYSTFVVPDSYMCRCFTTYHKKR
jgi:hypothetical protein